MLVSEILTGTALRSPEGNAIWCAGEWLKYGDLLDLASRFAGYLLGSGVEAGDRVGVVLENGFDYVIAHFGILLAGAVEVSLDPSLRSDALSGLLSDCGAIAVVGGPRHIANLRATQSDACAMRYIETGKRDGAGTDGTESFSDALDHEPAIEEVGADDDLASIVYTSGSTGKPKGVCLTHRNLTSNAQAIVDYLELREDDRMMVVLPFHYIYGRSLLYTHLLSGGAVIIDNRFQYPSAIIQTMEEQATTCLAGVPSTFSILLQRTDITQRKLPHLRLVTQAGGAMAPALCSRVREAFAPAELFIMYGCTEAAPRLSYLPPKMVAVKEGSIGRPVEGVEMRVVDHNGKSVAFGEVGELVARGPNIMRGYWNDPNGTAEVLRDGWYWTGDLGFCDAEGYFFITGRAREIIKSGGYRIGAREIEDALMDLPGIHEVAVLSVPDPLLGEAVVAFVGVSDPEVDERCVRAHLKARLPLYKIPKTIVFLEELPKNASGKIDKEKLRLLVGDQGMARE